MKAWSIAVLAALGMAGCQQMGRPMAPVQEQAEVSSAALGVAFTLPPGLRTRPCGEGRTPRCLLVYDPSQPEHYRDQLTIEVIDGSLEAVAAQQAGFERNTEGKLMTTYGRFMPVEVESFRVNGNPGLRAVVSCGISDPETGFHAAGGECLSAVINDGTRNALIDSYGYGDALDTAEGVVASLRFLPPQ